jgi:hypothetical protein
MRLVCDRRTRRCQALALVVSGLRHRRNTAAAPTPDKRSQFEIRPLDEHDPAAVRAWGHFERVARHHSSCSQSYEPAVLLSRSQHASGALRNVMRLSL